MRKRQADLRTAMGWSAEKKKQKIKRNENLYILYTSANVLVIRVEEIRDSVPVEMFMQSQSSS